MHYWQLIAIPAAIGVGLGVLFILSAAIAGLFKEGGKVDKALEKTAFVIVILVFASLAATLVCAITAVTEAGTRHGCISKAHTIGVQGRYKAFGGCFLEKDGQWVPDHNWVHNDGN